MTATEYRTPAKHADPRAWVADELQAMTVDGVATIAYWRERWWRWRQGCWREVEKTAVENWIVQKLNTAYDGVVPEVVSRMLLQLRAAVAIDNDQGAPHWLLLGKLSFATRSQRRIRRLRRCNGWKAAAR